MNGDGEQANVSSRAGRGGLAQVIATRGGKAPPEAPLVIEHREALIFMLCEAAELEHGIMCQYLFAAFTLKQTTDEGLTEAQVDAVTRWRKLIAHVGTEEMLHLALVHNILSAVGAAPHMARANFPAPAHYYPAGVHLGLVPFGETALRHFMFLERPEGMQLRGADELDRALEDAVPLMGEGEIVPRLQEFSTVGHLYRSIEEGLDRLASKYGEEWLFVGPPRAQATTKDFGWPQLVAVTDLASAHKAIDTILEQGEGARGDWQDAHFGQFVRIADEFRTLKYEHPDFEPARPVLPAKVRLGVRDESTPLIDDPLTARFTDLFNVGYEVLLQMLERYFAHTEETDAQLSTLADVTVGLMLRVLKPLGELITTLPVGPAHPGMTAGPSFELFYESDYLMPHRGAAWALLEERLRELATFCDRVSGDCEPLLSDRLAPVKEGVDDLADQLAAHFGDWGAVSRYAKPGGPEPATAEGAGPEEIIAEARGLRFDTTADAEVSELIRGVGKLLRSSVGGALLDSVLRPLAVSGSGAAVEFTPAGEDIDLGEELWPLAQAATRLRVAHPSDPALAEATACLQRLAIESSGRADRDRRLADLWELQRTLETEIRVSRNGPYLVAGGAELQNWLGEPIPITPQTALCRCGASRIKPFCDGSHARIGFSDEKSPDRVEDKRDTYEGLSLTIYDNRGICQHSGFCTDRLATVFRAGQAPFVAPSGGRMDEIVRAVRDCPSGALSYAFDGVEARAEVDRHGERRPSIEVTRDGPYRVTGGVPLRDHDGRNVRRAHGSSREHYALCRCGQSLNKPFCSGMHWYVEFHDPLPDPDSAPTVFEWAGGLPALTRMTRVFYEKHVPGDALLAPLFAGMSADHPERVAKWLGEVFGGPKAYSEQYGGYDRMISQHLGKRLTEEQRARWVSLLLASAGEAGLPNDPEFRSAFQSYLEWGSRLAVENSQTDARPPEHMPMPSWDWSTAAGAPDSRVSALAGDPPEEEAAVVLPAPDEAVSFEKHIRPLFRDGDRRSMRFAFDLWSLDDVRANAEAILERLRAGTMPCDGAWPPEWVEVFERWVQGGMNP